MRCDTLDMIARGDYAANTGDIWSLVDTDGSSGMPGPSTLAAAASYPWNSPQKCNGIMFQHKVYRMADISDGASNTYLVGEKYIDANDYFTFDILGDAQPMYIGFDMDTCRCAASVPLQDTAGYTDPFRFGSAHAAGTHMAFCDGSVQSVSYSIDPTIHKYLANRNDGHTVDAKKLTY
jgi:prepilin-type processing-associated H-X9-DG protein